VTLVVGVADGPLVAELPDGVEVIALVSAAYRALFALPGIVARQRPDVIFCPGSHYTGAAAWTRLRLRARCPPIVGKVSNALDRGDHGTIAGAGHRAWLRLHPYFLDRMVAMTPAMAAATITATGIARTRVAVIANPPTRRRSGVPRLELPDRYILGVGRLAVQKRWDRLIAALPRLADRDVPLVILGEGAERGALMAQAASLGVAHRLHLPGHAADPLGAMERAAVVVLTSDYEGVPGVLREALSVGTPVVATDSSPAVREIVTSAALGDVVARDDGEALVLALNHWIGGAARPAPVMPPGADSVAQYLELFDSLV
jgi:glycosyltransferase involved in cell wall biosynthesis